MRGLNVAAVAVAMGLFSRVGFVQQYKQRKAAAKARADKQRELEAKQRSEALLRDLASMVCSTGKAAPRSLSDLPPDKRTVALRFYDLKAAVCRPFAK